MKTSAQLCNINPDEIRARRLSGTVFSLSAVIITLYEIFLTTNFFVILLAFLLWFAGFYGLLQAKYRFCASYGFSGIDNTDGTMKRVQGSIRREYFWHSAKIAGQAFALAGSASLLVYIFSQMV
ncbi:MAG: hypothetical protein ACOCXP_01105 [Candidatus Dojkabacteria bacterium]